MAKEDYDYSTAQSIVTDHLKDAGDQADTSIEFMDEPRLISAINEIKRRIINAPYAGMIIDRERRIEVQGNGKGWDFKEEDTFFTFVIKTSLAAELASGDSTVTFVDGTNLIANGAFVTYDSKGSWDFITYGTKASTNVANDPANVDATHASGREVNVLYPLPADFARSKKLTVYGDLMYEGAANPADTYHYAVHNGFLWMPRNFGPSTGTLEYWTQPVDITALTETLDTPKEIDPVILHLLNARAFGLGGEDESMISDELFKAADSLNEALGYTVQTSNKRIRLARGMVRSPTTIFRGRRVSRFDEGFGY